MIRSYFGVELLATRALVMILEVLASPFPRTQQPCRRPALVLEDLPAPARPQRPMMCLGTVQGGGIGMAASAGLTACAGPRAASARAASAKQKAQKIKKKTAKKKRSFTIGCGAEYRKHLAFRRNWGLIRPSGKWVLHEDLLDVPMTGLSPREVDLLHIIWLVLQKKGYNPRAVDQAWLLCQSICRQGGPYKKHFFRGRLPGTPGFHLPVRGAVAMAPCVLPRGKLWFNCQLRLGSGAEMLQLQGVAVPSSIPWWRTEDMRLLKSIAGNAFTVTVIGCHCLVALLALASAGAMPPAASAGSDSGTLADSAGSAAGGVIEHLLDFASLADFLCQQLARVWPECFGTVANCPRVISLGTLCSGGDFVVLVCRALVDSLCFKAGMPLSLVTSFACEYDPCVRAFRKRVVGDSLGPCWHDVHRLPLGSMSHCDLLVFGSSCKSLSSQNNNRRSLLDIDASDAAATSGSTLHGCFSYVEKHRPKIIIMENVTAMLSKVAPGNPLRNIDIVYRRLDALGYKHGHGIFDSRDFMVPQSRARVYIWAAHPGFSPWVDKWAQIVGMCRPHVQLGLSACLLA